jgi:hypothetical protein
VYDLYEWLRFCSSSTVLNSKRYKITSDAHISSQKHQNEKNDEKNHKERDHHDLPFPAGLLHDHSHSFLHKQKGRSFRVLNSQVRRVSETETYSASFVNVTGNTLAKMRFHNMHVELLGK